MFCVAIRGCATARPAGNLDAGTANGSTGNNFLLRLDAGWALDFLGLNRSSPPQGFDKLINENGGSLPGCEFK
ncbi:MAG: hypothetical protein H7172_11370 [Ferruginibacter sp.]|nr:hypothetical protein [Rhodoferax sp.]